MLFFKQSFWKFCIKLSLIKSNPYDNNFYGNKVAYDLDNTFSGYIPTNTQWKPNSYTLRQTSDGNFVADFSGN